MGVYRTRILSLVLYSYVRSIKQLHVNTINIAMHCFQMLCAIPIAVATICAHGFTVARIILYIIISLTLVLLDAVMLDYLEKLLKQNLAAAL